MAKASPAACTALGLLPLWEEAGTDQAHSFLHMLPLAIGIVPTSTTLASCNLITGRLFNSLLTGSPVYYTGILPVSNRKAIQLV